MAPATRYKAVAAGRKKVGREVTETSAELPAISGCFTGSEQPRSRFASEDSYGETSKNKSGTTAGKSLVGVAKLYASGIGRELDTSNPQAVAEVIEELEHGRQESIEKTCEKKHQNHCTRLRLSGPKPAAMTTRNKPRSSHSTKEEVGDPHEEQTLWTNIRNDIGKLVIIQKKQITLDEKIRDAKESLDKSATPTSRQYEELDALLREQIKLCQEEQKLLKEEPADIIRSVEILMALRAASGDTGGRGASVSANGGLITKDRQRKTKTGSTSGSTSGNKLVDDGGISSAIGSPGVSPVATAARLKGSSGSVSGDRGDRGAERGSTARSGSVVSAREGKESSVKPEDGGSDAGAGFRLGWDGSTGVAAEKAGKFFVGAEVAYKQAKPKEDGSQWIQCTIVSITEKNGKRRYEVEDADVDDPEETGVLYTAGASALIAIPPKDADLPEIPAGKAVLAQYPDTTVFYRAKVVGYDENTGQCRLNFEEDQDSQKLIDRRLVLSLDK